MNYPESQLILEEIKKANKILVNCHRSPDPDSFGSALAMYEELLKLGNTVEIICPSEDFINYAFLDHFNQIKYVKFEEFNFTDYDLLIAIDSSSWDQVTDVQDFAPPIKTVVIDHHETNTKYGAINLVMPDISSAAEVVYGVLEDWGSELTKSQANALLTGVIGDTGAFRYPEVTATTLKIAGELIDLGANKNEIIFNIFNNLDEKMLQFWGLVLTNLRVEHEHKFAWSAVSYVDYAKIEPPQKTSSITANMFFASIRDTNFGFILIESQIGKLDLSLRARTDFDTSKIAVELGGGGHKAASGAEIIGKSFDEAVSLVLETAKKYANQ